jgi:hypothetical protein
MPFTSRVCFAPLDSALPLWDPYRRIAPAETPYGWPGNWHRDWEGHNELCPDTTCNCSRCTHMCPCCVDHHRIDGPINLCGTGVPEAVWFDAFTVPDAMHTAPERVTPEELSALRDVLGDRPLTLRQRILPSMNAASALVPPVQDEYMPQTWIGVVIALAGAAQVAAAAAGAESGPTVDASTGAPIGSLAPLDEDSPSSMLELLGAWIEGDGIRFPNGIWKQGVTDGWGIEGVQFYHHAFFRVQIDSRVHIHLELPALRSLRPGLCDALIRDMNAVAAVSTIEITIWVVVPWDEGLPWMRLFASEGGQGVRWIFVPDQVRVAGPVDGWVQGRSVAAAEWLPRCTAASGKAAGPLFAVTLARGLQDWARRGGNADYTG